MKLIAVAFIIVLPFAISGKGKSRTISDAFEVNNTYSGNMTDYDNNTNNNNSSINKDTLPEKLNSSINNDTLPEKLPKNSNCHYYQENENGFTIRQAILLTHRNTMICVAILVTLTCLIIIGFFALLCALKKIIYNQYLLNCQVQPTTTVKFHASNSPSTSRVTFAEPLVQDEELEQLKFE